MYQALYRKWRPKTFADVIGQEHITETLRRQVAEGRTSHAYLFTGTRGTGKTTCAKILAKAVNCEAPVNGDPCGKCPSCAGIDSGSFLDVLELDAASNNGVDQVRSLRDEAVYSPANVRKRVYIVDEVHMLSTAAFNALLKILEEPPEHLMFILATTELHKVPATILSRCQRFSFRRIRPEDVAKRLRFVAEQEHIGLRPDGAELLSRLADGALRDGLSLLDQCAAAGGTIDAAAVLDVLGLAGNLQTARLMELILNRDAQSALLLLDELYKGGKDMGAVLSELSTLTRDLLLQKTAPKGGAALLSGGFDAAALDRLGKNVPAGRFLHLASTLQRASAELYASVNRRLDTELCLLRLCDESLSGDLTALEARIARLENSQTARAELAQRPAAPPPLEQTPPPQKEAPRNSPDPPPWDEPPLPEEPPIMEEPGQRVYDIPEDAPPPKPPKASPPPAASAAPAKALDGGWWRTLIENCKNRLSPMYRPFLGMCSGFLEGDLLTVCAPDDLTLSRLDNGRVRETLEQEAESLTGSPVRLALRTGEPPKAAPEENLKNLLAFSRQFDNIEIKE
nr:DNA polymerase III subunit gamma/tau [uncultured Oscillibacter sp.]